MRGSPEMMKRGNGKKLSHLNERLTRRFCRVAVEALVEIIA